MLLLLIYFTLLVGRLNALPDPEVKIVGGQPTDITIYPYQASLQYFYRHRCGAAIVSTRWAISAAHCTLINGANPTLAFSLRVGTSFVQSEGQIVGISRIVDHPNYGMTGMRYDYDITLIQLSSELTYTNSIQPIALPPANQPEIPGAACTITGWGALVQGGSSPARLHMVVTPWISRESCAEYYAEFNITESMMCSGSPYGGRDACQGDSGGPLAVDRTLIGVVSWGRGCAQPGYPGVYADVAHVRQWISDNAGI